MFDRRGERFHPARHCQRQKRESDPNCITFPFRSFQQTDQAASRSDNAQLDCNICAHVSLLRTCIQACTALRWWCTLNYVGISSSLRSFLYVCLLPTSRESGIIIHGHGTMQRPPITVSDSTGSWEVGSLGCVKRGTSRRTDRRLALLVRLGRFCDHMRKLKANSPDAAFHPA